MKDKHKKMYMEIAEVLARTSCGQRLKVGTVVVKNNNIISTGYNALPAHIDGSLEDKEYMDIGVGGWLDIDYIFTSWPLEDEGGRYRLVTKPEVRHSEKNALMGLVRSNENAAGATLFCTHACCKFCAIDIVDAGITKVVYKNDYRNRDGLDHLESAGVVVEKYNENA